MTLCSSCLTFKESITSGFLQVQFLASVIGMSIQQHVEFHYDDMYRLLLTPCQPCFYSNQTIHIMWVKFSARSTTLNHICPLVPMDSTSRKNSLS